MDKETLSNYGWIVILVLVLAVMLALATPFGNFIVSAIKSTTQGLFDVNQGALDAAGISIPGQKLEDGTGEGTEEINLNPNDGTTPQEGDKYESGDYIYTYGASYGGWKVSINTAVTDKNQKTYGPILESINGEPVTTLLETFFYCQNLEVSPRIHENITNMDSTFYGCISLKNAPEIPSGVTNMEGTFQECSSIVAPPVLPDGVKNLHATFGACTSLITAPIIPDAVENVTNIFGGCSALKTYVGSTDADGDFSAYKIPLSNGDLTGMFYHCEQMTKAPKIPDVYTINMMFEGCKSLQEAPDIPVNVRNMNATFKDCTSITASPKITNVYALNETFSGCTSLVDISQFSVPGGYGGSLDKTFMKCRSLVDASSLILPGGITSMHSTFMLCTSLEKGPDMQNMVKLTSLYWTFTGCESLKTAPLLTNCFKLTNIECAFSGCTSLTGSLTLGTTPTKYTNCLYQTQITEILGNCGNKTAILATK